MYVHVYYVSVLAFLGVDDDWGLLGVLEWDNGLLWGKWWFGVGVAAKGGGVWIPLLLGEKSAQLKRKKSWEVSVMLF